MAKQAIIIGAGPGGLTTAYELVKRSKIKPVILEMSGDIGGISKTKYYKGNRIDLGGHRFFSKSERVMNWWQEIFPIQNLGLEEDEVTLTYHKQQTTIRSSGAKTDNIKDDNVMLIRNRLSRIYYLNQFFDYPVTLSLSTLKSLGLVRILRILSSYFYIRAFPIKPEESLEDFYINRFGKELYNTFFKHYTEKVWGVPVNKLKKEWGAQRVKGLSVSKVFLHAVKSRFLVKPSDIGQKGTETSLIEKFLYPKFGPGQLWEEVAKRVTSQGGKLYLHMQVIGVQAKEGAILSVIARNVETGETNTFRGDYFISTMPVKDLIAAMGEFPRKKVRDIAKRLNYRDFVTVGLLVKRLKVADSRPIEDNWIYIQERSVRLGRLQIFNNWSPFMVNDLNTVWLGLEYFCNVGDELWDKEDEDFIKFAQEELSSIGIIDKEDILDSTIIRMEKTYPVYDEAYEQFDTIRNFTDELTNLFLIGRNGMHRYNNADHSMLTGMIAVDNILAGIKTKSNIWAVNTEDEYHESK